MADQLARMWGRNIKEQRDARGWTQENVANRLGDVTRQSLSKWEKGLSRPTPENQARLAGLFGMSVPMLFPIQPVAPSQDAA